MHPKRETRVASILEAHQTIMKSLMENSAAEWLQLDLTMGQVKALFALRCSGAMPIGGLAERLKVGLPAASIVAEKLVHLELAKRHDDPTDRRRTFVELTPKGEQLLNRLHQGRQEQLRAWLAQMREADFAALVQGLQALMEIAVAERPESLHESARPGSRGW